MAIKRRFHVDDSDGRIYSTRRKWRAEKVAAENQGSVVVREPMAPIFLRIDVSEANRDFLVLTEFDGDLNVVDSEIVDFRMSEDDV